MPGRAGRADTPRPEPRTRLKRSGGVSEETATFCTKSQLALEMLTEQVAESALPACWVTDDKDYGRSTFWTGWPR